MLLNTEAIRGSPTAEAVRTVTVPPGENLRSPQVVCPSAKTRRRRTGTTLPDAAMRLREEDPTEAMSSLTQPIA